MDSPMNRAFLSVAEQLLRSAPTPAPQDNTTARSSAGQNELQSLFARLAQQPVRRAA